MTIMTKEKQEFLDGWKHFCSVINFGQSALDANAIRFMNEFVLLLDATIEAEIEVVE